MLQTQNNAMATSRDEMSKQDKNKYAIWRNVNFVLLILGYVGYYFVKYSFKKVYGGAYVMTGVEYGALGMSFNMVYGFSKFLSGNIADRTNARYFLCGGLILTSTFNFMSGAIGNYIWIMIMLMLVAVFQGWGWPATSRMLTAWFSKKERGTRTGIWNTSHNIGGGLAGFLIIPLALLPDNGQLQKVWLPSILGISIAVICFFLLKVSPKKMGLPIVEVYRNEDPEYIKKIKGEKKLNWKEIFVKVLTNKWIWIVAIANIAVYVIRLGVGDYIFKYIGEYHGFDPHHSQVGNIAFLVFEWMGIPAAIMAGFFTDKILKGDRRWALIIGMALTTLGVGLFLLTPQGNVPMIFISLSITGFFVYVPQLLVGVYCMDIAPKGITATATGFTGLTSYVAAAIIGNLIAGAVLDNYGWTVMFLFIMSFGVVGTILFSLLLLRKDDFKSNHNKDETTDKEWEENLEGAVAYDHIGKSETKHTTSQDINEEISRGVISDD